MLLALVLTSDALLEVDDVFVGGVFRLIFGELCNSLKLFIVCY